MIPVLTDLRNAYEEHDREAFDRHLKRVEEMLRYSGPIGPLRCAGSTPARSPSSGEDCVGNQPDVEPGRECCLARGGTSQGTA